MIFILKMAKAGLTDICNAAVNFAKKFSQRETVEVLRSVHSKRKRA